MRDADNEFGVFKIRVFLLRQFFRMASRFTDRIENKDLLGC